LGQHTDDYCERWCAILNKCSIDLMTLIVDQLKKDFIEMDNTIKDKLTALQTVVNDDGIFNELMKTYQALQDKLSTEIKELKIKKFNQEKKDKADAMVKSTSGETLTKEVLLPLSMTDAGGMPLTSIHPCLINAPQPAPHRLPVVVFYSTRDWTDGRAEEAACTRIDEMSHPTG
jgi:hypothetical protein